MIEEKDALPFRVTLKSVWHNGKHYVAYSVVYIDFTKQSIGIYQNYGSASTYT